MSGQGERHKADIAVVASESVEWGIERDSGIEWNRSVGPTHNYPYTAESVWGLASGRPVWRRTRTRYRDRVSEPERATRPGKTTPPADDAAAAGASEEGDGRG